MFGIKNKGIDRKTWKPLKKAITDSPVLSGSSFMKMEDSVILIKDDCSVLIRHSQDMNYFDIISFIDTMENLQERMGAASPEETYFALQDRIPGVSFTVNEDGMMMIRGIVVLADPEVSCRCVVRMAENCMYAFRTLSLPEKPADSDTDSLERILEDTFVQHQTMNNGSMPTDMVKLDRGSYQVTENNVKNVISCSGNGDGFISITPMGRISDMDSGDGSVFERYRRTFSGLACPSLGVDRTGRLFYGIHIDRSLMDGVEVIFTSLYGQMETSMAEFARRHKEPEETGA